MENFFEKLNIRIFVFGTLRKEQRLDFYMEGSGFKGIYYTKGQLMESENGSAYIDFNGENVATIGELYGINYFGLQRIDHLESNWGDFPKAYDLSLIPVWEYSYERNFSFDKSKSVLAFCYTRRNARKILSGDWKFRTNVMAEIGNYLKSSLHKSVSEDDVIHHIKNYLDNYQEAYR